MIRHKVDSQRERRILTSLVVSKEFLAHADTVLDMELVDSDVFRTIATWCIKYFRSYGEAPLRHLEDMFIKWSENQADSGLVESIRDFLEGLSEEYEKGAELNVPYMLDQLREYLAKRKIVRTSETISYALKQGEVEDAEEAIASYRKVEIGQGTGFTPLNDRHAWRSAFSDASAPVIVFEGDAGRFLNHALTRDALVGIQAPEKTGKTWWCIEFVIRSLRQRRKVAFFQAGDLSQNQIMRRLGVRWARRPMHQKQCGRINVPRSIRIDETSDSGYRIRYDEHNVIKPLTEETAWKGAKQFMRACGNSPSYLRTSVHPTGTLSVRHIENILEQWDHEHNFIADVIIIDYADILAPEDPKKQGRDQINDTWMAMRSLSQKRHALVIAPTQANAASYVQEAGKLQTRRNFSEDKRKLAHVTAMLALNQTWEEKEMGGMRLNWIAVREAPYNENVPLYVGTCFSLGRALSCASLGE